MSGEDDRREEFQEAFDECDRDGNGTICFDEFVTLMHNLDADMSDREYKIGFGEIDRNRNGRIDFDEFYTWWTEH